MAERTIYVSPDGSTHPADGQVDTPVTLDTATNNATTGDTIIVTDGIYTDDSVTLGRDDLDDLTYQAADGVRPLFVHSDGAPPAAQVKSGVTVDGLWFGGVYPGDGTGRTITLGANCIVQDCTLFNFENGLQNGSDAHGNILRRNRLVRCGYTGFSHPIYVANLNSSLPEHGVLTEECIIVASQGGYALHYYHQPSYGLAQYNFCGDSVSGLALQGDEGGPVRGNYNIMWTISSTPLYYSVTTGNCDNNIWQGCSIPGGGGPDSFDANRFVDPVPTAGTNPVVWQEADVVSNLGDSSANIDAAITALDMAFQQTVAQIHADETIETHFATLKAVIDTWKANTV